MSFPDGLDRSSANPFESLAIESGGLLGSEDPLDFDKWARLLELATTVQNVALEHRYARLFWLRMMERGVEGLTHLIESLTLDDIRSEAKAAGKGFPTVYWTSESLASDWLRTITDQIRGRTATGDEIILAWRLMDLFMCFHRKQWHLQLTSCRVSIYNDTGLTIVRYRFGEDERASDEWLEQASEAIHARP